MPKRNIILATDETYHIYNRSLKHVPLFTNNKEYDLFFAAARYYIQNDPPVKFSYYRLAPNKYKLNFADSLVQIIAYCLMPNHFHLILKQVHENGIKTFIHRLCTSYSHYFNIKNKFKGPVFESRFKAVRIETQEQLLHLSRYIHLNPVTAYMVEDPADYKYSSYLAYIGRVRSDFLKNGIIMDEFNANEYKKFVLDQKDYQRELKNINFLTID